MIFVVDSSDRERLSTANETLKKILREEELKEIVLLIFANKSDLPNCMNVVEITEKLELMNMKLKWFIKSSNFLTSQGIEEGLEWMLKILNDK